MADLEFNTTPGQTIPRELLITFLNVGTSETPDWRPIGKRVESSDISMDWGRETVQDVLGNTWTTLKKPEKTQTFDPIPLDAGDPAVVKLWNLAVREENAQALANQDMLLCHFYVGAESHNFAERYTSCAVPISRNGGSGGGNLTIGAEVTYGGERILGTVTKAADGKITFTASTAA